MRGYPRKRTHIKIDNFIMCFEEVVRHTISMILLVIELLAKSLNTLSYFTQLPYHPSFSVLLKILKSHKISMHRVSFQKSCLFYNSCFKCIEQGVLRIKRVTFSRYYRLNLKKCEIVFKFFASNCTICPRFGARVRSTSIHWVNRGKFF